MYSHVGLVFIYRGSTFRTLHPHLPGVVSFRSIRLSVNSWHLLGGVSTGTLKYQGDRPNSRWQVSLPPPISLFYFVMANSEADLKDMGTSEASMPDIERGYARLETARTSADDIELGDLHDSPSSENHGGIANGHTNANEPQRHMSLYDEYLSRKQIFWDRLRGKGRKVPGWRESAKNTVMSSCKSSSMQHDVSC